MKLFSNLTLPSLLDIVGPRTGGHMAVKDHRKSFTPESAQTFAWDGADCCVYLSLDETVHVLDCDQARALGKSLQEASHKAATRGNMR